VQEPAPIYSFLIIILFHTRLHQAMQSTDSRHVTHTDRGRAADIPAGAVVHDPE
jgi:hypothetical protein